MKIWAIGILCCVLLPGPAAAADNIPLDAPGFTAYVQQKVQLYSPLPVVVTAPLELGVKTGPNQTALSNLTDLHGRCVHSPATCPDLIHAYVQDLARSLQDAAQTQDRAEPAAPAVPGDKSGFVAYVAAKLAKLMPDAKIEAGDLRLTVTRPGGREIPLDMRDSYRACGAESFRCGASMDDMLAELRDRLVAPDKAGLRASLHIMASCNVIASVGNTLSCTIRPSPEPLAPFFRRAFANLEEVCFKALSNGAAIPATNADRKDLDLSIGDALDLCGHSTQDALGPLAAKLHPLPAGGVGAIDGDYAASYALFPADWSGLAAESGGHFLIAVPSRDHLLYMKGDDAAAIAALGARARTAFFAGGLAVSLDVYRWNGDGFTLATAQSAMIGGPIESTDLLAHAPH